MRFQFANLSTAMTIGWPMVIENHKLGRWRVELPAIPETERFQTNNLVRCITCGFKDRQESPGASHHSGSGRTTTPY